MLPVEKFNAIAGVAEGAETVRMETMCNVINPTKIRTMV